MFDPKSSLKKDLGVFALIEGTLALFLFLTYVTKFSNTPEQIAGFRAVVIAMMAFVAFKGVGWLRFLFRMASLEKNGQRRAAELADIVPTEGRDKKTRPYSLLYRFGDGSELRIPAAGTPSRDRIGEKKTFLIDPEDPSFYRVMPYRADGESDGPGDGPDERNGEYGED